MSSETGGVKPMSIAGRYVRERERLLGMTDAERALRAQWLKDQNLSPNEPRYVPQLQRELQNPIRRFYRLPLDMFGKAITPVVGAESAMYIRYFTGKIFLGIFAAYAITYYFKYNKRDWTSKSGWRVKQSRTLIDKGHPEFPKTSDRKVGADYASFGFKNSPI